MKQIYPKSHDCKNIYPAVSTALNYIKNQSSMKNILFSGKAIVSTIALLILIFSNTYGQITKVGATSTALSTTTTLTLTKPTGVAVGDIMLVNIVKYLANNTTNPSLAGWTLIDGKILGGSNWVRGAVLYRVVDGTEGSNFVFSLGADVTDAVGALVAYSGVNTTNPFDVAPGTITVPDLQGTTVNPAGITTVTPNALIIMIGMCSVPTDQGARSFSTWSVATSPSLTEVYDYNPTVNGGLWDAIGAAAGTKTTVGPTGTGTITVNDNSVLGGIILALRARVPIISSFTPVSACYGSATTVTITGSNFTNVSNVSFNGVSASYTVNSSTQITATLPATATTGPISITNAVGTSSSTTDFGVSTATTVANFSASTRIVEPGSSTTFTDLSTEYPNSWSWSFPGGSPSTSTSQNPVITYNTAGTYNVTLTATNCIGSDAETKTGYITVASSTTTYTTPGISDVSVPTCATGVIVQAWGAGGGGSNRNGAAGAGGGGAFTQGTITGLTGSGTISVTVGAGGAIGSPTAAPGNFSSVTSGTNTIQADGGLSVNNSRTGGAGGTAQTIGGIIEAAYTGGKGGNARNSAFIGNNEAGGGGGGSAFTNAVGNAGSNGGSSTTANTAGGTGTGNGGGGAAADGSPDAEAGFRPGGGGGGRGEGSSTSQAGANGQVIITWIYGTPPTISTDGSVTAVCYNAGAQTTGLGYTATTGNPTSYSIDWVSGPADQGTTAFSFAAGGGVINNIALSAGAAAGTYNGTMTIRNVNGCTDTKSISVTIVPTSLTWDGSAGNVWNDPQNWTPAFVPISCTDVIIPYTGITNFPTISSSASCHNITISSGASLVDTKTGTPPNDHWLIINGTATVEREIANDFKWHNLSSPVADQAIWPQFAPTPDVISPQGWAKTSTTAPYWNWDFYYFNSKANISTNLYWVNLRNNDGSYNSAGIDQAGSFAGFGSTTPPQFTVGRGYLVAYNTGWTTGSPTPTKHSFAGKLNSGEVNKSIIKDANAYNLVGNPYASSIDWKATTGWSRSSLRNNSGYDYWVWNENYGNYGVFNSSGTTGSSDATRYIAPTQGFFVEAASSGNLIMDNSIRVHSTQPWLKNADTEINVLRLKLTTDANTYRDEMIVDFNTSYTGGGSAKFWSLYAEAPELYSVKDGYNYSIDRYRDMTDNLTVNINAKCGVESTYTITATNIAEFSYSDKVVLEDLKTGTLTDLKQVNSYSFAGGPSDAQNRFKLIFKGPTGIDEPVVEAKQQVYIYSYGSEIFVDANQLDIGSCDVYIYNALGQLLQKANYTPATSSQKVAVLEAAGVYIVKVVSRTGNTTAKIIIP